MTDTTRDAFEAWAASKSIDIIKSKDDWGNDIYQHPHVDSMWFGWQAATLAAQPEGYQLVPIEPTEAMLSVGNVTLICGADEVYRAMLSATPQGKI